MQVKVSDCNLVRFNLFVAGLNKRANKIGVSPINVTSISSEVVEIETDSYDLIHTIEVSGDAPKVAGWTFVGQIEHDADVGNVVKSIFGSEIPKEFWESKGNCDHCNTNRVRNSTFILKNEAGAYKQVGGSCIKDFSGYANPSDLNWVFSIDSQINDELYNYDLEKLSFGAGADIYKVDTVLARSIVYISKYGYISRATASETGSMSTADEIKSTFSKNQTEWTKSIIDSSFLVADKVLEILTFVKSWNEEKQNSSEFNRNLFNFVTRGVCRSKDFGYICCLPVVYKKHQESLESVNSLNEHVGSVGDVFQNQLTVKAIRIGEGFAYNTISVFYTFSDAEGRKYKWITSKTHGLNEGDSVTIKGKIKGHSEWKDIKFTDLTRCKFL
jgi:hypothetical protein